MKKLEITTIALLGLLIGSYSCSGGSLKQQKVKDAEGDLSYR